MAGSAVMAVTCGARRLAAVCAVALALAGSASAVTIDFNDNSLAGWTALGGTWSASGGQANQTATHPDFGGYVLQYDALSNGASFTLEAQAGADGNVGYQSVGLAFHVQDAGNYYSMQFFPGFPGGAFRFVKWIAGVQTWISTPGNTDIGFDPQLGALYTIRVQGTGTSYTASIWNGTSTAGAATFSQTYVDSSFSAGKFGVFNQTGPSAHFDNVIYTGTGAEVPDPSSLALAALGGLIPLLRRRR